MEKFASDFFFRLKWIILLILSQENRLVHGTQSYPSSDSPGSRRFVFKPQTILPQPLVVSQVSVITDVSASHSLPVLLPFILKFQQLDSLCFSSWGISFRCRFLQSIKNWWHTYKAFPSTCESSVWLHVLSLPSDFWCISKVLNTNEIRRKILRCFKCLAFKYRYKFWLHGIGMAWMEVWHVIWVKMWRMIIKGLHNKLWLCF